MECKILKGTNKNDNHHHEYNRTHNAKFRKDCANVVGILLPLNSFLKDSSVKVGAHIACSEEVHAFVDSVPELAHQQYKEFVDTRFIRWKNLFLKQLRKIVL